jgi:hypothetical protein
MGMRASGYERDINDWYQEPTWLTEALLDAERIAPGTRCWDPSCGEGRIPDALKARGLDCAGSDIANRGYGDVADFFTLPAEPTVDVIISNPPFSVTEQYARHALKCATNRVILLGRLALLESQARAPFFAETPLARVWVSRRRASMPPGGRDIKAKGGTIPFAWFVWAHGHVGAPTLGWI